jgi:tetratricopeptide (TPR) repeat protein
MRRILALNVLVVGLAAVGAGPTAAQEEIKVVDHVSKKESLVKGAIDSESPEGIKVKSGKDTTLVPAVDVKYVQYRLGDVKSYEYSMPFNKESKALEPATKAADRLQLLRDARGEFDALGAKMAGNPNAVRFIQFKSAQVLAELSVYDVTQIDQAIAVLKAFKADNDKSWELVPALKLLAEVQERKGDVADARQTYLELVKIPNLPKEMKQDAELLIAQLSIRAGKLDDAEKILDGLRTSLAPNEPQRGVALVYLAQTQIALNKLNDVEATLKGALAATSEPLVKGLAHNALGDYYRKKNLNDDAFWEYLRVDALYSQDRNEHAKALYYLSKLFADVKKDKVKAQEYLDKLKLLDDTPHAKMAATEK